MIFLFLYEFKIVTRIITSLTCVYLNYENISNEILVKNENCESCKLLKYDNRLYIKRSIKGTAKQIKHK